MSHGHDCHRPRCAEEPSSAQGRGEGPKPMLPAARGDGGVPLVWVRGGDGPHPFFWFGDELGPMSLECPGSGVTQGYSVADAGAEKSGDGKVCKRPDVFGAKAVERAGKRWEFTQPLPIVTPYSPMPIGFIQSDLETPMQVIGDETGSWLTTFYVVSYPRFQFVVTLHAYDEHKSRLGWVRTPLLGTQGGGVFQGYFEGGLEAWIKAKLPAIHFWTRHVDAWLV